MNNAEFSLPFEKLNTLSLVYLQGLLTKIPNIIKHLSINLNAHINLHNSKNVDELKDIFNQLELHNIYISIQVLEVYITTNDITSAKKQLLQVEALSNKALMLLTEYFKENK